ncbi:MAG: hypothetical protein KF915_16860 [Polyangiaceae bacterium]|nr:hypothetical protein [Polyangiaceae bacterium]
MTRTRKLLAKTLLLTAAASLMVGATTREASACGGAWVPIVEEQIDWRVPGVLQAERLMDAGKSTDAAASVVRMMPHIKSLKMSASKPLVNRALRVLALSVARTDGRLDAARQLPAHVQDTWLGKSAEDRQTNLTWATDILRKTAEAQENDPQSRTELAEALARTEGGEKEALGILEELAKADLVTSPEGYAALAHLRQKRGDRAGTKLAMERCEAMAKDKSTCAVHG